MGNNKITFISISLSGVILFTIGIGLGKTISYKNEHLALQTNMEQSDQTGSNNNIENPTTTPEVTNSPVPSISPSPSPIVTSTPKPTVTPVIQAETTPLPTVTPTPVPTPTQTPKPSPITYTVYDGAHIDQNTVIKNSNKFNVAISNLNPKVGENVTFTVTSSTPMNCNIQRAELYGNNITGGSNGHWSADYKTYTDKIIIQDWSLIDNEKIESYIFIKDTSDDKAYEYKFILTVKK